MGQRAVVGFLVCLSCAAWPAQARDAFVILSGGISPFDNNYSQYLQARALADAFERRYPPASVWVFFGAGNVEGQPPVIADVHRQVMREGLAVDTWLPGALPRNRPATREVFLAALRTEILPAVAGGGTLYLMVGDHGSRGDRGVREARIDLWSLERDPDDERGWNERDDDTLSVSALREALSDGLGEGQVVFVMTQCHSGGFHYLAVPRTLTPDDRWFSTPPPARPRRRPEPSTVRAAGFTATDERSIAAGCDPSPDPEHWVGYERLMPERLLGQDLFTGAPAGAPSQSFAEAHAAATLADETIDKPYSTSEQYLDRWAALIETQLASATTLTTDVRAAVAEFARAVDGVEPRIGDPTFRARQAQFGALVARMGEQNPAIRDLVSKGTRRQLEDAVRSGRAGATGGSVQAPDRARAATPAVGQGRAKRNRTPRASDRARHRLWHGTVAPAWHAAVDAGEIDDLTPEARIFERHLLDLEDGTHDFIVDGTDDLRDELYWFSGYGRADTVDRRNADAWALWAARRSARIFKWAAAAPDPRVRRAASTIAEALAEDKDGEPAEEGRLDVKTGAARTLFYRRVLGAWAFLLAVDQRPALQRVQALTALERTPLPPEKSR